MNACSDAASVWTQATLIEPRLLGLETAVRLLAPHDLDDVEYWPTYSEWKARLCELVGWSCDSGNEALKAQRVYHVCLDRLLAIYEGRQHE